MTKIIEFITDGALIGGIRNWVWLAALAIIAAIAFVVIEIADNRDKRMIQTAEESGAVQAQSEGKSTTLQQNKDAADAGNQVRDNRGNAMFDECVRSATPATRANCAAFRNEPVPD